ncbi:hypothetical protein CLOSTMETH_02330 [[Clostridium] methylpentosum DSM 5476]|uniref:Uncharacterized protein n=1 Tax=[Clostridium] methylpentosum DSM 5476 TaxID=537013 RepID=C0EEP1_9FIRM|nr:hypothetical protein CLOSTMETH_02330 [[Clostridium] methylpentosum DSM 5476]
MKCEVLNARCSAGCIPLRFAIKYPLETEASSGYFGFNSLG